MQSKYIQVLPVNHTSIELGGKRTWSNFRTRGCSIVIIGVSYQVAVAPILIDTNGTAGDTQAEPADDRSEPNGVRPS